MPIQRISDREVVKAFVNHLATFRHPGLQIDRIPEDERDADVDAVAGPFAIEHTSVDTVENQRRDASWFMRAVGDLEAELRGHFAYHLTITVPYEGIKRGQRWSQIKASLKSWLVDQSPALPDGRHHISGISDLPFDFHAAKRSNRTPGVFFARGAPSDDSLSQRVRELLETKARKLKPYGTDGYIAILLVESQDIALMNQSFLVAAIRQGFAGMLPTGVNEIWYADTAIPSKVEFSNITASIYSP